MPKTSVHFPQSVLAGPTRLAKERGMSRNRLIVEEREFSPADLLSNDHLSEADLHLLRTGEDGFLDGIEGARSGRVRPPF